MTTTSTRPIRRMFDDGGPLLVQGPAAQPIAIDALCCVNPRCGCREMDLYVWRVDRTSEPQPAAADILSTKLHIDTGALRVVGDVAPSNTGAPSIEEMRTALTPDLLEYLRCRWQRVKGRQNRQEWQTVDWSRIELDALVPFMEIFPSAWDLTLMANRRRYWAVDCWCLTPGCTCAEIAVDFLEDEGRPVGMARIDVGAWAVIKADNDEAARLGDRLVADPSLRRELHTRRTAVRGVARALPRVLASGRITRASYPVSGFSQSERCPASAGTHSADSSRSRPERHRGPAPAHKADARIDTTHAPKVGRNMPCPCGSGKKHKRCCGA